MANLLEKCYSPLLVSEFYSRLLIHASEYENPVRFDSDVLYMFIYGQEQIITEFDFGKLIGCEYYGELFELPMHYQTNNVWDTLAHASNLKSLLLRFLHHFIASTVLCMTGSFVKLTTDDIWLLDMASKGTKINLSRFIMNKMLKVLKHKERERICLSLSLRFLTLPSSHITPSPWVLCNLSMR